jgi:DNA-binding NarL/FixJ family response regulator
VKKVIIAILDQILFQEIVEMTARDEKTDCLVVVEEETLWAALQEETPEVILIDLGISTADGSSIIQKLKQNSSTRSIPIVAFGNQIRADLLQDAKECGADIALPKSAFREQLPGIIRHYCKC